MTMKLIKKTGDYSIYQRGDERYAVKDADKQAVNGEEKVRILAAEGLITVSQPSAPAEPEETADESTEGEAPEAAADETGEETGEEGGEEAGEEAGEEVKDDA